MLRRSLHSYPPRTETTKKNQTEASATRARPSKRRLTTCLVACGGLPARGAGFVICGAIAAGAALMSPRHSRGSLRQISRLTACRPPHQPQTTACSFVRD